MAALDRSPFLDTPPEYAVNGTAFTHTDGRPDGFHRNSSHLQLLKDLKFSNNFFNNNDSGYISLELTTIPSVSLSSNDTFTLNRTLMNAFDECELLDITIERISLSVVLLLLALSTIFGNSLVIIAILKERYLHTVTNYFIMSLAVADCLVGTIVMPFSAIYDSYKCWFFGANFCDVWHSFDVLASTASILNLCVISMDRYWAVTDPVHYPAKMTHKKAYIFIALVWVCSALISFPAIAWWRARSSPHPEFQCHFTEDVPYLLFSSTISFYGPLLVMVFTYYRIYKAAVRQTKALKQGRKCISQSGNSGVELRIHVGGSSQSTTYSRNDCSKKKVCFKSQQNGRNKEEEFSLDSIIPVDDVDRSLEGSTSSHNRSTSRNFKYTTLTQKIRKFAKEKKAAKTLGIVMGVFIVCWLPFFVNIVLQSICGKYCSNEASTIVTYIVTWLGWTNSAMNPVIYACMARDFRRAFLRILCCCCPGRFRNRYQNGWRKGITQMVVSPVVSAMNTPILKSPASRSKYSTKTPAEAQTSL